MIRVKHVEYVSNYKLKILFSDGKTKIVDFENWINQGGFYVIPMKDIEYFKKVEMDESNYSICWPNGADFSPDALYEIGRDIKQTVKKAPFTRKRQVSSISRKLKSGVAAKPKH